MKKLSWKAVRRGDIYCAPACGARCTYEAYKNAVESAKATVKLMQPQKGWKIRVWENLGWHWEIKKGNLEVHFSHPSRQYWATLSEDGGSGDSFDTNFTAYCTDPNRAVEHKLQIANNYIKKLQQIIKEVS